MIVTKTQQTIIELFRVIGTLDQQQCIHSPFLNGIRCPNSVWPNILFDVSLTSEELKIELPRILELIRKGKLPNVIMFDPELDHSENINWLKEQGFRHRTWTGMVALLSESEEIDSDLRVAETTNIEKWVRCVESTLMGNEKLAVSIFEELAKHPSVTLLEGKVEDDIVSTAIVFTNEAIAGLLLVGTKETYRNQGFGSAITLASKNLAYKKGCTEMYLHATTAGKSTYLRCGFVEDGIVDVFDLSKVSSEKFEA